MGVGSVLDYGAFAIKGILFFSPKRGRKATIKPMKVSLMPGSMRGSTSLPGLRQTPVFITCNSCHASQASLS